MTVGTYTVESATTSDLVPAERADFWTEHVAACQSRLDCRYPRADFHGTTVRQRTSSYQLVEYRSDQVEYARTAGQVRRDPDEDYRFLLPLSGECLVRRDGRQVRLSPGAGVLLTLTAPVGLRQDGAVHGLVLTIPAHELDGRLNRSAPVAGLSLATGLGRVAGDMLIGLARERDRLTGPQFDAVGDRIVELLCMLATGDDRPDAPGHLAEVEAMVRRYAREHAADPELTGATMAQALGWSLRQVQLALQRAGTTPRELIREERLRLARDRLRSPDYHHLAITDLAHATGFSSASALSTAFRRRFGRSPREVRYEAAR